MNRKVGGERKSSMRKCKNVLFMLKTINRIFPLLYSKSIILLRLSELKLVFIFFFFCLNWHFSALAFDGTQDRVPRNIAPWHTEFKWKESQKTAEAGGHSELPSYPSLLKQFMKALFKRCSPYTEKNCFHVSENRGMLRRIQRDFGKFP